jgi:hypothetical protein
MMPAAEPRSSGGRTRKKKSAARPTSSIDPTAPTSTGGGGSSGGSSYHPHANSAPTTTQRSRSGPTSSIDPGVDPSRGTYTKTSYRGTTSASAIRQGTRSATYYSSPALPTYRADQPTYYQSTGSVRAGIIPGGDSLLYPQAQVSWYQRWAGLITEEERALGITWFDKYILLVRPADIYASRARGELYSPKNLSYRRRLFGGNYSAQAGEYAERGVGYEAGLKPLPLQPGGSRPSRDNPQTTPDTERRDPRVGRPGTRAGDAAIYQAARDAGLSRSEAITATAIALGESGGNPRALNDRGEYSMGLWQINMRDESRLRQFGISSRNELYNPKTNARAMAILYKARGGWEDWSVYNHDTYREFLGRAQRAAGVKNPVNLPAPKPSANDEPSQQTPTRTRPDGSSGNDNRTPQGPPTSSKAQPPANAPKDIGNSQVANPRSNDETGAPGSGGTGGGGTGGGVTYENPLEPIAAGSRGPDAEDTIDVESVDDTVDAGSASRGGVIRDSSGNVITDTRKGPRDKGVFAGRSPVVWIIIGVVVLALLFLWRRGSFSGAKGAGLKAKAGGAFNKFVDTSGDIVGTK